MYLFLLWLSKFSCAGSFVHQVVFHRGTNRTQKTIPEIIKPEVIATFFFERDLLWLPWTVWGTTKFQLIQTHVPQIKAPNVGSPFPVLNLDLNRTLLNVRVGGLVGFNPLPQKSSQRSFRFLAKKQPPGMWKPPPQCHGHLPSTSTDWKFKPAFTTRPFPPFRLGPCHARMLETSTVLLEPFPFFGVSFQGISDFSLPHPW